MKTLNTKNSFRNLLFGVLLKFFQIIVPFIIRTILIYYLGIEYAGLNSLFTSILQVLNVAELGVSSAMLVGMYKPIVSGDNDKVCKLLNLYKKYYRIIGLVILVLGLAVTPALPFLIAGEVPEDINLYVIYFLNLGITVASYWLFAYRASVLQANQRTDVISKVTFLTNFVQYAVQIVFLITLKSYYLYLITSLAFQIINNIVIAIVSKKMFPSIIPVGQLDNTAKKYINGQIKDLFTYKLGMIVTLSVDSIVISAFLGLVTLGIYQNYYYIVSAIISFFQIFYQSIRASVGSNLVRKNINDNFEDYKKLFFIVFVIICFCCVCMATLFQDFIILWVGEANLLNIRCVFLFVIYLLVYESANLIMFYRDCAGKWHTDKFRPLITAAVNLILNIILVNFIGIYGILISTIIAYVFVYIPWGYSKVFSEVFNKSQGYEILKILLIDILFVFLSVFISFLLCSFINTGILVVDLILKFLISSIISIIFMVIPNLKVFIIVLKHIKNIFLRRKNNEETN